MNRRCLPLLVVAPLGVGGPAFADAEHYEQIRVDGGVTGSTVAVSERNGVGFVAEVKAMANDNVALGGRIEFAVMFGGHVGQDNVPMDVTMAACGLLKGEYLFGTGTVRPFVGLGAGLYTIGSHSIQAGPNTQGIETKVGDYFGIAPQLGIDLGRMRLAATYNAIIGAGIDVHETVGAMQHITSVSQNYLSVELSFRFGGGPKPDRVP
jgi:outer membrane protein X